MGNTRLNIEADEKKQAEAFKNAMSCIEKAENAGRSYACIVDLLSFEHAVMIAKQGRSVFIDDNGGTTTMEWHNRRISRVTYVGKYTVFIVSVDGECITVKDHCFSENGTIETSYIIDNESIVVAS